MYIYIRIINVEATYNQPTNALPRLSAELVKVLVPCCTERGTCGPAKVQLAQHLRSDYNHGEFKGTPSNTNPSGNIKGLLTTSHYDNATGAPWISMIQKKWPWKFSPRIPPAALLTPLAERSNNESARPATSSGEARVRRWGALQGFSGSFRFLLVIWSFWAVHLHFRCHGVSPQLLMKSPPGWTQRDPEFGKGHGKNPTLAGTRVGIHPYLLHFILCLSNAKKLRLCLKFCV